MTQKKDSLDFSNPPIEELVCGIYFDKLQGFLSPHPGLVWNKFKRDYPTIEDKDVLSISGFQELYLNLPPLRRTWMINEDETDLIQLQDNAFFCNWRKKENGTQYPKYETVIQKFKNNLKIFYDFLSEENTNNSRIGEISIIAAELTYINHFLKGRDWDNLEDIATILPNISTLCKKTNSVEKPETIQIITIYDLPDNKGKLIFKLQEGLKQNKEKIYILELSAKYLGKDINMENLYQWFDMAHNQIRSLFKDITGEDIRKDKWGQK